MELSSEIQREKQEIQDQDSNKHIIEFQAYIKLLYEEKSLSVILNPLESLERLKIFQQQFKFYQIRWISFCQDQKIIESHKVTFDNLNGITKQFEILNLLYKFCKEMCQYIHFIRSILWSNVCIIDIEKNMTKFQQKATFLPSDLKNLQVYIDIQQIICDFFNKMKILYVLSDPSVTEFQWMQILELTGFDFDDFEDLLFWQVFDSPIFDYKDEVFDICNTAKRRANIFSALKSIENECQLFEFSFETIKNGNYFVLNNIETNRTLEMLEDSIVRLSTLHSCRYVGHLKKEVDFWIEKLNITHSVISECIKVQNLWIKLETVFSCDEDLNETKEAKMFSRISNLFIKIINNAIENKKIVSFCYENEEFQKILAHLYDQLSKCQESLSNYLEK